MSAVPASMSGCTPPRRFEALDVRSDFLRMNLTAPPPEPMPLPTVRELPADGPVHAARGPRGPRHSPVAIPFPDPEEVERQRLLRQRAERIDNARTIAAVDSAVWRERERHREALDSARDHWRAVGLREGWTGGVQWGMRCGFVAGCMAGGIVAGLYVALDLGTRVVALASTLGYY